MTPEEILKALYDETLVGNAPRVLELTHEDATFQFETFEHAVQDARVWASEAPRRGVIVTGSITLVGEAIELAKQDEWKK